MTSIKRLLYATCLATLVCVLNCPAQSLGNAGTVNGMVADPSGAAVPKANIVIENPISGYRQTVTSESDGTFRLVNIPPNQYHLQVQAPGFGIYSQDLAIRGSVPIQVKAALLVAGAKTSVTVESAGADVLETNPSAHVDVDRSLFSKLPNVDPAGGLSQAIVNTTGGVVADGNGFFHPVGDHAQVTFVVDGQPISDQQSKVFSTQLPTSAIQSMELITGTPNAEFGDKTSLVAEVTTRSGLGSGRVFGTVEANMGSFTTAGGTAGLGFGNARMGNFVAVDGVRSGRFLDTPEFQEIHDVGNNQTIFDRFDYLPNGKDAFHLNLFTARNWTQIPNSYDQLPQDQRQRVMTWSIAPGYQRTVNANTLITVNPYVRKDQFSYYASRDPFDDTPATQSQARQLLNLGIKADVAISKGRNQFKFGVDAKQTRLREIFGFGITDPAFNSPCLDRNGDPSEDSVVRRTSQCQAAGFTVNPDFSTGVAPFDLTRGGRLFSFLSAANINQIALYGQDTFTAGNLVLSLGFRFDHYSGLASSSQPQPRLGIAYNVKRTGTVLRAAYARTMETPFNENLLLSSATGVGGLAQNVFGSDSVPIQPGFRNQFNGGLQQALGRYVLADVDFFWKYTHGAYDFGTLLNTTITFPVALHNSRLNGYTGRVGTTNIRGFVAYYTFGHTRARYFPPQTGGLIPQGEDTGGGVFLIDHDQKFQSALNLRYQHKSAEWISFTHRYDNGLVVSGIPDSDSAINDLTPNQQVTIGLACGGTFATVARPITTCLKDVTSNLITLPKPSDENDDHNPDRVKPHSIFNLGFGTDNLLHREGHKRITASVDIGNLTNKVALYNFLSTFSGTHFIAPRTVIGHIGFTF